MTQVESDRQRLHELGYAQELNRKLGWFSNFAVSFSIISILAGGLTSFWIGMFAGGPIVITLGWIIVGFFVMVVGMSMGEIVSTYPTAGALYYWSARLARSNGARWAWYTAWFNLLGQIGVIASVDYALSVFTAYFINLFTPFETTAGNIFWIFLIYLVAHGLLNTFGVNLVKILSDISVWWHVIGVVIFFIILLIVPDNREGFAFVGEFRNTTGWTSAIYAFFLGFLLAQYTITGFDASAHVSEETVGAATEAPKAIVRSIYVSAIAALVLNVAMIQATPAGQWDTIAGGFLTAAPELFLQSVGSALAKLLLFIAIVAQFFCGMAAVTANSRMIFAFARDGGLPGSKLWAKINTKTRTPTTSLWLGVVLSAILGTTSLYQNEGYSVAFFAMTAICVVGLYIAYAIPIYLRLTKTDFEVGPWHLGKWSRLAGWTSIVWVVFISLLFFAPIFPLPSFSEEQEAFINTFNWSGPLVVIFTIVIWAWWHLSAKRTFTGPKAQENVAALEQAVGEA